MKKIQIIIFLQLLVVVSSCQIGKKTTYEKKPMPEWVSTKPQSTMYYIGISSAPKKGFLPADYMSNAQQKALGDLSSDISVNIESTSVLSIIEHNYNINENFSSEITASTNQQLEGYELVDTWEDDNFYWVYYRLSKSQYQALKEEKKQQTILDAKNKYYQATELLGRQLHYNAFQFYVESLTALKPYLGESTVTDINGEEKDLGNVVFTSIANFVNNLKIVFDSEEITVKKGIEIDHETFSFRILDENNNPVSSIPVKISFTGTGLIRNSEVSSNDGRVFCALKKIKSAPNVETLSISIDMVSFSRAAKDPMIRSLIKSIPATETKIRVNVEKPYLTVISEEKSFGKMREDSSRLKTTFEGLLSSEFVINENHESEFTLKISSNTIENGRYYDEYQVTINYTIDLTDNKGNVVYRKTSTADYSGNDLNAADNKAYIEVAKSIERIIIRELISAVNK
ncbi:MAG TPA: LPP20 family lipoprotein [Bacteroidales bacterium]|nr:LPP20 family lipoprotein [Bacteroidales bacterium]